MASADAIDGVAVTALESRTVTPIAQLDPELSDQNSRSVRGEVTITWPYNRVTHTLAFLLAEPDVRLRRTKGQVRVQLHGPSAKAVSECGLGACDEVLLSLDGVEWAKEESPGRILGARVDWQLQFNRRLVLQVKLNGSDEPKHINVDSRQTELPNELPEPSAIQQLEQTVNEPEPALFDKLSAIRQVPDIALNEYPSPAFIKRARISYGSLFDDGLDIFEEDGGIKGKGRKRSRFARKSNTWRYSSKSPTPEPEIMPEEDPVSQSQSPDGDAMEEDTVTEEAPAPKPKMTDGASQTVESEMTPSLPAASGPASAEKLEASPRPAIWEKVDMETQETSTDTALQETEAVQAASHILGMANGAPSQSYTYQHTDSQAHPAANSQFGSSKPMVPGLSMFGTPASVPVESEYGIANQVRFGFSHTPQIPQSGVPEPQMHAAPEPGPYPDSYLDHSVPAKYEGMESYMNIAQSNPELQHGQDYNLVPVPTGTESFERGQWEMATQAPHYNPIEGGHFGADALNEGTPAIIEDHSLHADPTRPDQVPKGFSSYGPGTEDPVGFEESESRAESEQDTERSEIEELAEDEVLNEADEDDVGVDDEVEHEEFGEELEEGDYDQREYNKPESDDEGIRQDEEEAELEAAERYGEDDVYDDDDDEMDDYAEDWERERTRYDEDEDEDEDAYESEDPDLSQRLPRRAPAAAASADPVVISLLSDSEDEDKASPPPQPAPPVSRRTMARQLSIRHSSPPVRAPTSTEGTSLQQMEKSLSAEKEEPTVEQPVAKEEPTENSSKSWVGPLDKSSSADQMDHDLQPKEDAKPLGFAMEIVHTQPAARADAEVAPTSDVAHAKDASSELGSPAQNTEPLKTINTPWTKQAEKHESDLKPREEALPKTADDQLKEQQKDPNSESEVNDETFEGFSSDTQIFERPEEDSESAEDEMLDEDEEENNEIAEEDKGDEEEQDASEQVVDLLDTTSEEEDEEEEAEEGHEEEDDDFEPVESESEEEVLEEIHEEDKAVVDEEGFKKVENDDEKEVVLEVEEEKKIKVEQEVEEKDESAKYGEDEIVDEKAVATEATGTVEAKETDTDVSEVKDTEPDVQEVKAEKSDVKETSETADEPKKEEPQADQGEAQGSAKTLNALEETVQETISIHEERAETSNVGTISEAEPKASFTTTSPADEREQTPDRVEEVDEMEAIQHQLFEDMVHASREASMMEVSDAEHVSFMSQDTPRPIQLDSDEEMGDGDDGDVEMADAATPRPETHTEEDQVSQAVEVEMTSETIEVDSDSMSVSHEESVEVVVIKAPHVQDFAMEDAEMVVEVEEETQITVEKEVTVTEAPAVAQASPFATVDVTDHAHQQAVLPSSPPIQPFASQVAEDQVMLVGSSSPAKEADTEKPPPTPDQSGLLGKEVTEPSQPEEAQVAAETATEECMEVITQVEVVEETETVTTKPQVATVEEGVETQDEVSLIVVEEISEEQTQDLDKNQADEADTDTQPLSASYHGFEEADKSKQATPTKKRAPSITEPAEEETTVPKEKPSQTTVTPNQSQTVDDKDTDLSDNLARQAVKASAKRGRKQQSALEPLRTSARITRARSRSVTKSVTAEENEDASKAAALASPSKRSFASSFNSSAAASEDNTTPQPSNSHHPEDSDNNTVATSGPLPNDPSLLKLSLSRLLRTQPQFANCLPLKSIRNHLGKNVDILAIVSSPPTNPTRAKGGPREYMMSFNVTDPSTAPTHVVEVQMYRAHKESLPIVKPGDAILLKQVEIRSMTAGKGFGLRTGEGSAWAVFEAIPEEDKEEEGEKDGDDATAATTPRPPQIKGPAVEDWEDFGGYMVMLKKWYRLLLKDETAKGKLEKAVKKFEK
ncbi:hypothetical protein NEUTE1DRAFT_127865 [Neurospora tetrasperma FGSC 2508]|uniref:Telomeric single stranded DNA binding POT1/Cdc13 domain-containing protein n=1 Tax=Neurospora tetrasperma (strain FGSC 2508 / ATCC MYA-4615 / P0657) TaxID=510951 RepID=F8MBW4_NEUT8|nr:uncharacterized protein NEUTE1DRAFT_127865 [Neurospora tetrasperma FGSC 2508]EGO61173.1 hypothetical protein NEUTE1DRAFT_127865 [Neurospora tetrasperma FGSC 2508]EGZ74822.1 hypothetical protein NEUTE2DRAFT_148138 [Neurospora tetrasperma FGSC 2509]